MKDFRTILKVVPKRARTPSWRRISSGSEGETFFDLFEMDKMEGIQPPPVPSHFLLRVLQISPTVKLAPLNYGWLKGVLANDSKRLRHHIVKTGIVRRIGGLCLPLTRLNCSSS